MKIESDSAAKHLPPVGDDRTAFADQIKQRAPAPAVGATRRHPARASDEEILKAMLEGLEQPGVSPDEALGNLQASLAKLVGGLNQVGTLHRPSKPDILSTGLERSQMRDLESRYFGLNRSGSGFDGAFRRALLTKIASFPNGAAIVANYKKLEAETQEAARDAFPNDPKQAAAAAAAEMRNRLFFALNPGLKMPPNTRSVNDCNAIIQRFTDEHGCVNKRVVGLIPSKLGGAGPGPIPFESDIPANTENAFYLHAGW
jgi:hypothetical protein